MRFFFAPFFPVIGRKEGENDKGNKHNHSIDYGFKRLTCAKLAKRKKRARERIKTAQSGKNIH